MASASLFWLGRRRGAASADGARPLVLASLATSSYEAAGATAGPSTLAVFRELPSLGAGSGSSNSRRLETAIGASSGMSSSGIGGSLSSGSLLLTAGPGPWAPACGTPRGSTGCQASSGGSPSRSTSTAPARCPRPPCWSTSRISRVSMSSAAASSVLLASLICSVEHFHSRALIATNTDEPLCATTNPGPTKRSRRTLTACVES